MKKVIRTATIALSLDVLLKGQLAFLSKDYAVVAISGADHHLQQVAQREKVATINVVFERKISPINDLVSLYRLYQVLRREKPFIVHSITPKAGLLTMIAGYFAGVPIRIHTFTGLIFPTKTGFVKYILILMDKILCRFATAIYPEGEGVKNDLLQYKITKKQLKILGNGNVNGLDSSYFDPSLFNEDAKLLLRKTHAIQDADFVYIFVGRLVEDKGINELVAAFSLLTASNPATKLLLVGPLEQHLNPVTAATLHAITTNKNIISVGYQDDVRPFLAIANCLVFPSYREGFPNVVLQAGAMGLPSIVTDINGCNEIIKSNINGLILPVKDENAIFAAMQLLEADRSLYHKLQSSAREHVISRFEQQFVWNALLEEYKILERNV